MNNLPHKPKDAVTLLRRQIGALEESGHAAAVALGLPALDAALPWGGLPRGALHEIAGAPGDGAVLGFALLVLSRLGLPPHPDPLPAGEREGPAVAQQRREGEGVINQSKSLPVHSPIRPILWCRTQSALADRGALYGPGIATAINPRRMIFATVARNADALWVLEEGLRCNALSAVVGEGVAVDFTASRRLQLAARGGHALALLLPPLAASMEPSAALTRWRVTSDAAHRSTQNAVSWRVALHQCRGGRPQTWKVEANDAALRGAVAVPLADGPVEDASPQTIAG